MNEVLIISRGSTTLLWSLVLRPFSIKSRIHDMIQKINDTNFVIVIGV